MVEGLLRGKEVRDGRGFCFGLVEVMVMRMRIEKVRVG